jgi:adenosylcobyric acid synthase
MQSTTILGICGGYQMLGRSIDDDIESGAGSIEAFGHLPARTRFEETKITRARHGTALGCPVTGYQIHHGRTTSDSSWISLDDHWGRQEDGAADFEAAVFGTSLHGLFESDDFRVAFLDAVANRRGKRFKPSGLSFTSAREGQFDQLADLVESHLDMPAIERLIANVPES